MNPVTDSLLGLAVGDALGVPVEFRNRASLQAKPVSGMLAYGTHRQPLGTWSDDSSLAFCLAECLCSGFDLQQIGDSFVRWLDEAHWTAHGSVFDVGITTREAIYRLRSGTRPDIAGSWDEMSNGNGSLMRILPLLFHIQKLDIDARYEKTKLVSGITHGHVRSAMACFYYLEFAKRVLEGKSAGAAYEETGPEVKAFFQARGIVEREIGLFRRLLDEDISILPEEKISSSGYVLHTLEASMWCLLTTDNFQDAALKAVNLGEDTDTTGAVTGGLAGLLYGEKNIPSVWLDVLVRRENIRALGNQLFAATQ